MELARENVVFTVFHFKKAMVLYIQGERMIAKSYEVSKFTYALETLYKRLTRDHPKYAKIKEEYYQKVHGDYAEEVVMSVLEQLRLPYKFFVFHPNLNR